MRIALIHSGGTLWLAGNPALAECIHSSAAGLRISPRIAIQTDRFVRGSASAHTDRGNLETELAFSTTRIFATPAAAEQWAMLYDAVMPRTGTLVVASQNGGATSYSCIAGCVVEPPERQCIGCSVLLSYRVLGGSVEASVAASATLDPTGSQNSILLTAVTAGTAGNDLSAEIVTPVAGYATAASAADSLITITPGTKARMIVNGEFTDSLGAAFAFSPLLYAGMRNGKPAYTETGLPADGPTWGVSTFQEVRAGSGLATWSVIACFAGGTNKYLSSLIASDDFPDGLTYPPPMIGTGTPEVEADVSSAAQCIAACAAAPAVAALVTASNAPGSTGTGRVAAVSPTDLTGGTGVVP